MNNTLSTPAESTDSRHLAFGREVAELLSQSSPSNWIDDLWDIYTGYMPRRAGLRKENWATTPARQTFLHHSRSWCFSSSVLRG
ncbi:hypothetical protein [Dyadobacter sp.]|uniref:hypothetical protein n=1 Tax=Dyadobacter sp. TaxID=1914288 RepID=UPI0025B85C98|nr:hypothetical protein [Dyadobacter sp.]